MMTTWEAANYIEKTYGRRWHPNTIRGWATRGLIPSKKIGGRHVLSKRDLDLFFSIHALNNTDMVVLSSQPPGLQK